MKSKKQMLKTRSDRRDKAEEQNTKTKDKATKKTFFVGMLMVLKRLPLGFVHGCGFGSVVFVDYYFYFFILNFKWKTITIHSAYN